MRFFFPALLVMLSLSFDAVGDGNQTSEKDWGLGIVARGVNSAFEMQEELEPSFLPLMYYQGDRFFMRGLEGGLHLYKDDTNEFNIIGRMSLFDIPEVFQTDDNYDNYHFDTGVQWRSTLLPNTQVDVEFFSDSDRRYYGNISSHWYFESGDWEFMPDLTVRYKSADFNSHYYALAAVTDQKIGAGIEINANIETRYHVNTNLYLISAIGVTALDKNAYESAVINQKWSAQAYVGFAFFNDKATPKKDNIKTKSYIRLSQGWATPSDIGDIIVGNIDHDSHGVKDEYNNQFSSIFYGLPLTDSFFGYPVDIYLTPGFVWHWDSEVQDTEQEYVLALKAYTTFDWPVKWRIGLAEGLSYISDISYIEAKEMAWKGYEGSNLLNYIDISLDVNVGDLFHAKSLEHIWFGYGLHHRSAVFGSSSQFGRIKGGSNYNTLYIQFDF